MQVKVEVKIAAETKMRERSDASLLERTAVFGSKPRCTN